MVCEFFLSILEAKAITFISDVITILDPFGTLAQLLMKLKYMSYII